MYEAERLSLKVLQRDKEALRRMASLEGETMSVVVRRLIRQAAHKRGLLPASDRHGEAQAEEVSGDGDD